MIDIKNINTADDKKRIDNNISTKYCLVDNRNVAFTRLSVMFLHPAFFHQKSDRNPKALDIPLPLSHSGGTVSRL